MNFIQAQLTPNNVGIELFGSKECLISLYDAINLAIPEDELLENNENVCFLLGLTYDIRKAYSGYREQHFDIQPIDPKTSDACTMETFYGFTVVVPIVIAQIHVLSDYTAELDKDGPIYQTITSFINTVLEAIKSKSEESGVKAKTWLTNTPKFSEEYNFSVINFLSAAKYIQYFPIENRLQSLPDLLSEFSENHQKYIEISQIEYPTFDIEDEIYNQLEVGIIKW